MASLTLKGLEPALLERLKQQAGRRGLSLNAFARQLLARSVGLGDPMTAYDDLDHLAGSWSAAQLAEFRENTRPFGEIDPELWA